MDQEVLSTWDDLICRGDQLLTFFMVYVANSPRRSMLPFRDPFFEGTTTRRLRHPSVVGTTSGHQKAS